MLWTLDKCSKPCVQPKVTKSIKQLKDLSSEESSGVFSLEKVQGDIKGYNYLTGGRELKRWRQTLSAAQ